MTHPPLFVPPLTAPQRQALQQGLRSRDAFTARRSQILLASADRLRPAQIARRLGCSRPTARYAIRAFTREGLACLQAKSCRPHTTRLVLGDGWAEPLKDLLHQSPRLHGQATSLWTLPLVAQIIHAKGWTTRRLTGETIRVALQRLGLRWQRAKRWITSPDPEYARKKKPVTA